jgi:ribosomal protein S18 acetylase RimI-like enzyme
MTDRQVHLGSVLATLQLPPHIQVRAWTDTDMPTIQRLSDENGWPTNHTPEEVLTSWRNAWPALVATKDDVVIGYVRGLTDSVTILHITDLLVDPKNRIQGIGRLLLEICYLLYPHTIINLIAEPTAIPFYKAIGYRSVNDCFVYYKKLRDEAKA